MKTKIAKWGNSMAVRFPEAVAQAKLLPGDHPELAAEGSGVVVTRKPKCNQTLQDLLRGIAAGNPHKEIDWGKAEGNELW